MVSDTLWKSLKKFEESVLILVLMEYGLWHETTAAEIEVADES